MRDLDDALNGGLEARERELARLAPSASDLNRVVRGVRLGRARRATLQGVAVVAAGALLGTAGWWGLHRVAPTPALPVMPTMSVTPTTAAPLVTPSSSPDATPIGAQQPLVTVAGLPPMPQATPEMLAATTPGWVVVDYRPWRRARAQDMDATPDGWVFDSYVLLLVSPTGERYHLVDLPKDSYLTLDRWEAGTPEADVTYLQPDPAPSYRWGKLDLLSGAVKAGPGVSTPYLSNWFSDDGRRIDLETTGASASVRLVSFDGTRTTAAEHVALADDGSPIGDEQLDPSGRRLLLSAFGHPDYALVDLVSGGAVRHSYGVPGQKCFLVAWFDAKTVLALCQDDRPDALRTIPADRHPALYRITVDGSAAPQLLDEPTQGDPIPYGAAISIPGGVAAAATTVGGDGAPDGLSTNGTWLWTAARERPTELVPAAPIQFAPTAAVGTALYGSCYLRAHPVGHYPEGLCSLAGTSLTWLLPVPSGDASAAGVDNIWSWTVGR